MFSHRTLVSGRIPELLDHLKAEFESIAQDVNMYKMQRDDYERKLQAQLNELTNIQTTLFECERNHNKIKQQYEEEIMRLRRQLDFQNTSGNSSSSFHAPIPHTDNQEKAPAINGSSAMFFPLNLPLNKDRPPNNPPNAPTPPPAQAPPSPAPTAPAPPAATPAPAPLPSPVPNPAPNSFAPPKRPREEPFFPPQSGFPPLITPQMSDANKQPKMGEKKDDASFPNLSIRDGKPTEGMPFPNRANPPTPLTNGPTPGTSPNILNKPATPTPSPAPQNGVERQNLVSMEPNSSTTSDVRRPPPPPEETSAPRPAFEREEHKKEGSDWVLSYTSKLQTNLNVDLAHSLDHSSVVCCVKFSNDGKYLASGCNKSAQIYDVESGEKIHTFIDENAKEGDLYIRSVCFSPDGKFLAAGAEDKTVKVWDIEHKRIATTFVGHELDIYSLDYSSDNRFIISGSGDKKIKIWDIEKRKCVFTLGNDEVGPKDGVTSVAISPDGRLVAAGSLDRIVRLWDVQTGYFLERYEGHLDSVYSVAFSPDGKFLASGSLDKTLKLWDLSGSRSRSRCRSTFNGHKDFVLSVAFSPDGHWLLSGSKDRTVQFWDPRTSVNHVVLQGHKNSVISVALNPMAGTFATGSGDCRARIWRYDYVE